MYKVIVKDKEQKAGKAKNLKLLLLVKKFKKDEVQLVYKQADSKDELTEIRVRTENRKKVKKLLSGAYKDFEIQIERI